MSSPWSREQGDPLPCPGPGSMPRPGRFVSGTTTDEVHEPPYSITGATATRGITSGGAAAVNLHAGSRLVSWRPEGTLPTGNPQEIAMSPLLLIVFIPLFVGRVAFVALLFAIATAGSRDAFEQRPQEGTTAAGEVLSQGAPSEPSSARAA